MKSNTYELHNYADLSMSTPTAAQDSRKCKANNASNSHRNEKYSLRQKRRLASEAVPSADLSTKPIPATVAASEALIVPERAARSKKSPKAKTKAAPLSKYRRKTANARERTRMREINSAFEHLRHCVPQAITGEDAANTNEKLTKITTLRMAMKYISMLSDSLKNPSYESDLIVECLHESATREAHDSMQPLVEPEPTPAPARVKARKTTPTTKKATTKRQSKQQKLQTAGSLLDSPESCYASSSIGSPVSSAAASSPSSAYASLSSANSTSSDNGSSIVDADNLLGMHGLCELNSFLLESDGESLPLSDHCLNPSYYGLLLQRDTVLPTRGDMPMSVSSLDKADVELSLRLMDSSADSFDFSSDQQPSACISPLATLDSLNPFSDLLHADFPEANALDLFLT